MATLNASRRLDMSADVSDLLDYTGLSFSTTLIRLFDSDTDYIEFSGTGFLPNAQGQLVGGTLTGIKVVDVTPFFEVLDASMPAADFYTLADANDREGLLSQLFSGADAMNGSAAADVLYAYGGADRLTGNGGNDTLFGGLGNDTYVVTAGDVVRELSNQGNDTVRSTKSWTLGNNLENLVLGGGSDTNGTGNTAANAITGNDGANTLKGLGGKDTLTGGGGQDLLDGGGANDTLIGGTGADSFHFGSAIASGNNVDQIKSFVIGADKLQLDNDIFTMLAPGALSAANFVSGAGLSAGQDADDYLVYDPASGKLYYDADGSGDGEAALFAIVGGGKNHPSISAADFLIVD